MESAGIKPAGLVVESVSYLGKDLSGTIEDQPLRTPVIVCRGMAASAADRWVELRRIREEGKLAEDQALELERLTGLISRQADKGVRPAEIRISSDRLPFAVQDHQDYPVVVRLQARGQAVEFVTIMAVRTLTAAPEYQQLKEVWAGFDRQQYPINPRVVRDILLADSSRELRVEGAYSARHGAVGLPSVILCGLRWVGLRVSLPLLGPQLVLSLCRLGFPFWFWLSVGMIAGGIVWLRRLRHRG